jgi:hypothetical protein
MAVYALTIFTGAFLLFQVQPLIGKYILPWFGGGPGVWTTCMLFFQVLLLGGYAYAHFSSRWLKPRWQAILHLALLAGALAMLPITPADSWKPQAGGDPTLRILALLAASLGLPYFVLSATGPLMQHWFSRTHPGRSPYRLYALSNAGSLLALVSYPFFFETHLTRKAQAGWWAAGLAVYAVCCVLCAVRVWRSKGDRSADTSSACSPPPETRGRGVRAPMRELPAELDSYCSQTPALDRLLWLLLPACASVLLLATTNKLCQDVAVIPFLWVLPLALYLLSFIICFDSPRWYARPPFALALVAACAGICWALFQGTDLSLYKQVAVYSGGLFVCCMVCHGELYRLRPAPSHLTGFYLMIAAGGALGGFFVAVVAPLIFKDYYELHWGLVLCGFLFILVCATAVQGKQGDDKTAKPSIQTPKPETPNSLPESGTDCSASRITHHASRFTFHVSRFTLPALLRADSWRWLALILPLLAFAGLDWSLAHWGGRFMGAHKLALVGARASVWFTFVLLATWWVLRGTFRYWRFLTCLWLSLDLAVMAAVLWRQGRESGNGAVYKTRNFYGVLTVYEYDKTEPKSHYSLLLHGRITHGLQFADPEKARWPTSYYGADSGIARAVLALPPEPRRIGVVGLGTGTLSAYGRAGDYLRIYEINPQVRQIATNRFNYLSGCPGQIEVVLGDARLSMETETPQHFDLLALDAFSSDSIPVHLLTKEAFDIYERHLATNGIIAVHVSNHYLDLEPVVMNLARRFNYKAAIIDYDEADEWWLYASTWILLSRSEQIISSPGISEVASAPETNSIKIPLWTDDFASLFQILK